MLHDGHQAFVADPDDTASALGAPGRFALQGILVTQPTGDQVNRPARIATNLKGQAHGHARRRVAPPMTHDAAGSRRLRNLPTPP